MSTLVRFLISLIILAPSLTHAATLEIPGPGTTLSGVGVISGWKCQANGELTVRFDGGDAIPLLYGSERTDVHDVGACASAEVGFVAIWNWSNLDAGAHTAVAYDDGVEFARSTFEVTTLGTPFLQGASREVTVFDFPELGTDVVLEWQPTLQNFVIVDRVESPLDAPPGSRLYWAELGWARRPEEGVTDTVYWTRTDRSAAGSINVADDVQGAIRDFVIDAVEDKLYFLIHTEEGGAIHRVNLDGTQYEEVWAYQHGGYDANANIQGRAVSEISLDERGNIYLSIYERDIQITEAELRRLNIEEALSYPGDDPPKTSFYGEAPPDDFALQTVYDTTQIKSLFGSDDIPLKDLHIIGDTMYFRAGHPASLLYRARTDGSGVRREYGHYSREPYSYSEVSSLEVRDSTLWWVSGELAPDSNSSTSRIYRRQMGAAPGSEELVYDPSDRIYGSIVVAPIDETIYFSSNPLRKYQQGAESLEDHMTTTVAPSLLELVP